MNVSQVVQNDVQKSSRKEVVRKWSVRKVRRRPQNKEKQTLKTIEAEDETRSSGSEKSIIFFGESVNGLLPDAPIFISSDEDSATSEDGKKIYQLPKFYFLCIV